MYSYELRNLDIWIGNLNRLDFSAVSLDNGFGVFCIPELREANGKPTGTVPDLGGKWK